MIGAAVISSHAPAEIQQSVQGKQHVLPAISKFSQDGCVFVTCNISAGIMHHTYAVRQTL